MKLNVILITYKQERYIRQAIESILMQKTNFAFNIIVADDCSPDATLDIIREYAKDSAVEFHFLESTTNLGHTKNYQRAFAACNGEYIAIMEGDDYWTSPMHLQKHVDFLDKRAAYSMSFNRHIRFFEEQDREEVFEWNDAKEYQPIFTQEMIFINKIGNLSCCVFRNKLIKQLDSSIYDIQFADWLLGLLMSQYGPLGYLKETTSTYRIHNYGQWSEKNEVEQDKTILEVVDRYNEFLHYRYNADFQELKRRKTINIYGDKSLRGKIKQITPQFLINLYRKIF